MSGNADVRYPGGVRVVTTRRTASTTVTALTLPAGALFCQFYPKTTGILVIGSTNAGGSVLPTGYTLDGIPLTASVLSGWYPVGGSNYVKVRGNGGKSTIKIMSALGGT